MANDQERSLSVDFWLRRLAVKQSDLGVSPNEGTAVSEARASPVRAMPQLASAVATEERRGLMLA
ncbi:hypothetical protein WKK05_24840 [Nostoc sp. UHCC 0302]|uniref:hypothetical protein n=1 Tax=Nostoc sp. UHCC 0302 TaxID=3134896 RepID=UPI00311C9BEA